jgi:hypothetical protein
MTYTHLNKIWQTILEFARRIGRKLKDLYDQANGHTDLRRLSLCCIGLLIIVIVMNPFLGMACFLSAALFLSK